MQAVRRFNPRKISGLSLAAFVVAFGAIGGVIALLVSHAAVSITVDASVPQPRNIKAYGDDRSIVVTWEGSGDQSVVGYYITYKKSGASSPEGIKQTIHSAIQLQPLENGVEYEITVQSARGTYVTTNTGPLDTNAEGGRLTAWARANGRVSPAVSIKSTPTSARVDQQRSKLTGFFDDFNIPQNPFDERKWNNASHLCANAGTTGSFVNPQFHAHTALRGATNDCSGIGGITNRPRATFNTSTGINGGPVSESNPAQLEMDLDGIYDDRSVWYLDFVPLSSRRDRSVMDINTHNDIFDMDHEDPGNTIRINLSSDGFRAAYYTPNRNEDVPGNGNYLVTNTSNTACETGWEGPGKVNFYSCDMTRKVQGLSPIPQSDKPLMPLIPNVRRHWVFQITPTKMKIFIDSTWVADITLPAAFAAEKQFTMMTSMFSYNTGKNFVSSTDRNYPKPSYPYLHFYHWDNFGFTGASPSTVTHNYIDGGSDGNSPFYFSTQNNQWGPRGNRTTNIKVPDDIGNLVNNKGKLYFTIGSYGWYYRWAQGDHIIFNGTRYDFPDFTANMVNPPAKYKSQGLIAAEPVPVMIEINKSDIKKGDNIVRFNLNGTQSPADTLNVHLELTYNKSDVNRPSYTQPIQIYGQKLTNIMEPRMSTCDMYAYVEQDLNLPYLSGVSNLEPGPCVLTSQHPAHNPDHFGPVENLPPPDTTSPVIQLTAPANGTTVQNNTIQATANATDNEGVAAVEFYMGGILQSTDNSSPYAASINTASLSPGNYSVHAVAIDTSGNRSTSSAVNVIIQQPASEPDPDPEEPDPIPNPNPGKKGDINGDGRVTFVDLSLLLSAYNSEVASGTNGDLNNDGRVNVVDLSILLSAYGT